MVLGIFRLRHDEVDKFHLQMVERRLYQVFLEREFYMYREVLGDYVSIYIVTDERTLDSIDKECFRDVDYSLKRLEGMKND